MVKVEDKVEVLGVSQVVPENVFVLERNGKRATIDFSGDKVVYSGELAVDEGAKIFFESVKHYFEKNIEQKVADRLKQYDETDKKVKIDIEATVEVKESAKFKELREKISKGEDINLTPVPSELDISEIEGLWKLFEENGYDWSCAGREWIRGTKKGASGVKERYTDDYERLTVKIYSGEEILCSELRALSREPNGDKMVGTLRMKMTEAGYITPLGLDLYRKGIEKPKPGKKVGFGGGSGK